jgi:hypothetical protein
MERKDFLLAQDHTTGRVENIKEMHPADANLRTHRRHEVILHATPDELKLLARGLTVLRAQMETDAAIHQVFAQTDGIDTLKEDLLYENWETTGVPAMVAPEQPVADQHGFVM